MLFNRFYGWEIGWIMGFVRFYKECEQYNELLETPILRGCRCVWKDIEMTTLCFEEFGIRCPRYKRKSKN